MKPQYTIQTATIIGIEGSRNGKGSKTAPKLPEPRLYLIAAKDPNNAFLKTPKTKHSETKGEVMTGEIRHQARKLSHGTPRVSIGLPVYNGEKYLPEAIESLVSQTFSDFEIIISDNASTDDTQAICSKYAAIDDRIRYVRLEKNYGYEQNFQAVLDQARGEFFLWSAADDLLEGMFIEKLVNVLENNKDLCCAMSDVKNIFNNSPERSEITIIDEMRVDDAMDNWRKKRKCFFRNPTTDISFCFYGVFRKEMIRGLQINYRGMVKYASAMEIPVLAQAALRGPIGTISEPLKVYRRRPDSIYHTEQSRLSFIDKLNGFFNISCVLLSIIKNSELHVLAKIELYLSVIFSGIRRLLSFVFYGRIFRLLKVGFGNLTVRS